MFAWFHSWKERRAFRRMFRLMRPLLWKRYGGAHFYTTGQVLTTAKLAGIGLEQRLQALAVFAQPGEAEGVLRELGSLETQDQIRRRLLDLCFKDYREDNFEENVFICTEVSSGGGSLGSGMSHGSEGHSDGGHHS